MAPPIDFFAPMVENANNTNGNYRLGLLNPKPNCKIAFTLTANPDALEFPNAGTATGEYQQQDVVTIVNANGGTTLATLQLGQNETAEITTGNGEQFWTLGLKNAPGEQFTSFIGGGPAPPAQAHFIVGPGATGNQLAVKFIVGCEDLNRETYGVSGFNSDYNDLYIVVQIVTGTCNIFSLPY